MTVATYRASGVLRGGAAKFPDDSQNLQNDVRGVLANTRMTRPLGARHWSVSRIALRHGCLLFEDPACLWVRLDHDLILKG